MTNYELEPIGDRLIVKPEETEDVTKGGIVLPETAKDRTQRGHVIAVGDGRTLPNGDTKPVRVDQGDYVIYAKYGGSEIQIDGETYILLAERDIHAKIRVVDSE